MNTLQDLKSRFNHLRIISASNCGVAHLTMPAAEAINHATKKRLELGPLAFKDAEIEGARRQFAQEFGLLLNTSPDNISFVPSVNDGLTHVALGILSRVHPKRPKIALYKSEYPSNVFPWTRPDSKIGFDPVWVLGERGTGDRPLRFSVQEFKRALDENPEISVVSVSSVQFESGFKTDLEALGRVCQNRNVWFVVDAAQSLGSMPLDPKQIHASVVTASGWKWLGGPEGSAVLYTSPEFRNWIKRPGMFGPDARVQKSYSDPGYTPAPGGKMFELSTCNYGLISGLGATVKENQNAIGSDKIWEEISRLQTIFLDRLRAPNMQLVDLQADERAGILSFVVNTDPGNVVARLAEKGLILPAPRGGYLRVALHWFLTDEQVNQAADLLSADLKSV